MSVYDDNIQQCRASWNSDPEETAAISLLPLEESVISSKSDYASNSFLLSRRARARERERARGSERKRRDQCSSPHPHHNQCYSSYLPLFYTFKLIVQMVGSWTFCLHPLGAETRNRRLELELTFERMFAIINWMSPSSSCSGRSCESAQEFPHHEPTNYFPMGKSPGPDPCPAHRLSTNRSFLTNNIQIWNIVIDIEFSDDSFQS